MVDVSLASFTNFTNKTSGRGDTADVPPVAGAIIIIIINTITFPCTVVLNALVIKAVKTTPRLRTNSNILLACLAVTDALTGLLGQPLFVLWKIFLLVGLSDSKIVENCNYAIVVITLTASFFHLMFVTFERLIAIKFTMQYSNIITDNSMKRAVLVAWIISFIFGVFDVIEWDLVLRSLSGVLTASCIIFLSVAYFIMYRETRRHQEKIKTQQMPQEEVERFTKENKALKTTLYVVGAVFVCLLPLCFCLIIIATGLSESCPIDLSLMQTCAMLNSFVNPLIYCWRQKEMRQVIFEIRPAVVHIHNQ
ncbi:sphingosine 1-phosphate receptor 2-like [Pocillopora damicornis]|uniref:sphingosine 1-phosphate receptor 2-like n=1 Tax=Pocillopora damicornis TaxID=46731 RepID=UPI000F552B73|nr:sphingosine 1-phosphate receptor 2-like [Pocillopora damicornis]